MFDRQIRRRVAKIAPFLRLRRRSVPGRQRRPHLLDPGRLHRRPTAIRMPPSAARGVNYIRNSVKVVIDAYHGTVTFYLAEPDDPIVQTLRADLPDACCKPLDRDAGGPARATCAIPKASSRSRRRSMRPTT